MNTTSSQISKTNSVLRRVSGFAAVSGLIASSLCARPAFARVILDPATASAGKAAYEQALQYLSRSAVTREVMAGLNASEKTYRIVVGPKPMVGLSAEPGSVYDPSTRTIYWLPASGFRWRTMLSWQHITPALALLHELGHAFHHDTDPSGFEMNRKASLVGWDNREEKRTIREIENVAAKDLGESLRHQHNYVVAGDNARTGYYHTVSAISIKESAGMFASVGGSNGTALATIVAANP